MEIDYVEQISLLSDSDIIDLLEAEPEESARKFSIRGAAFTARQLGLYYLKLIEGALPAMYEASQIIREVSEGRGSALSESAMKSAMQTIEIDVPWLAGIVVEHYMPDAGPPLSFDDACEILRVHAAMVSYDVALIGNFYARFSSALWLEPLEIINNSVVLSLEQRYTKMGWQQEFIDYSPIRHLVNTERLVAHETLHKVSPHAFTRSNTRPT